MYGRSMYFDISKAKRELGWSPKYSNDDMFIESYSWYLQHRTDVLGRSSQGSRHKSAVELRLLKLLEKVL
jgi:dTDP-D-glucose 4,6-dehydratase